MPIDQIKDKPVIHLPLKDRFLLGFLKFLGQLSLKNTHRLCDGLYLLCKVLPLKFKRIIAIHIRLCFPDLPIREQQQLIKDSIRQTLYCLAEMPMVWFSDPQKLLTYIKQVSGEDIIKRATESGKSIIVLAPHLGSWEMLNLYASALHPSAGLYKPRKKAWQEEMIRMARERRGLVSMFPTSVSGVKNLYQALADKKWVGLLPDHDPGKNGGVYVPFFTIAANTMTLAARMAQKFDQTEVFLAYAERLPNSQGFHIHFIEAGPGIFNPDLNQAAASMNQDIEKCIRSIPSQYEWSYKRFRRRPDNSPSFY